MLDLRLPTGGFFMLAGLILIAMGLFSPETRAALTDVNVNLYCGIFMVIFDAARVRDTNKQGHWTDYPLGVAHELIKAGFPIEPANLYIRSTVAEGSGL